MRRLLIRVDDLVFSEGVNLGIEKSVKEGIIRSVGIMVNMDATKHGIDLLKETNICFGLHTNICVGKPICDPKLIPSLVDENGNFKSSKTYRQATKDFVVYDEVVLEVEAQYLRYVELMGEKPHYFEGHAVSSHNFFKAMEEVAKKYNCDYLPLNFNGPTKFRNTFLYTSMDSMKEDYEPFESLKKAVLKDYENNEICMFVCHPGYLDAYIMKTSSLLKPRVLEVEMACSNEVKQWLKDHDIKIISYDDLN